MSVSFNIMCLIITKNSEIFKSELVNLRVKEENETFCENDICVVFEAEYELIFDVEN